MPNELTLFFINVKYSNANLLELEKFLDQHSVDIVMLAESTKIYDQSMLNRGYVFNSLRDFVGKRRVKIFSRVEVLIQKANPSTDFQIVPRLQNKLLSFMIGVFQVLVVHIPHRKQEFDLAMEYVVNTFNNQLIDLAVGDFNFGYSEESPLGGLDFLESQRYLKRLEEINVIDTQKGKNNYSYVSNRNGSKFRLDHIFSKHEIEYEYIGDNEGKHWKGYDHKGMLFRLKINNTRKPL
jgi:hypothetical protein